MENDNTKFKQCCNLINYNTYNNIRKSTFFSTIGLNLIRDFLLSQDTSINNVITISSYISLMAYFKLACSRGYLYTKDINYIKKLYKTFINNYNNLNKIFNLENPIQIYTMFSCLLYGG